jgi:uncharacterized protein (TIGR02757 family)
VTAHATLRRHLERLLADTPVAERKAADPVAFPHRYHTPEDAEIAALFAAVFAYGRVDLFRPVVKTLLDGMDRAGGPRSYVEDLDLRRAREEHAALVYRWNRGLDVVLLCGALQRVLRRHRSLEGLFPRTRSRDRLASTLAAGVDAIRLAAAEAARDLGLPSEAYTALPRGLRTWLPSPADGSACKRWCLFLRWMNRPADGVDLGLWTTVSPAALVIPVDTHVLRVSGFLGLTARNDDSWRTAVEITSALAELDPEDPVRFDFALAHLGISGACLGHRHPDICPSCALDPVCRATRPSTRR